jgi:hypothetical protein
MPNTDVSDAGIRRKNQISDFVGRMLLAKANPSDVRAVHSLSPELRQLTKTEAKSLSMAMHLSVHTT